MVSPNLGILDAWYPQLGLCWYPIPARSLCVQSDGLPSYQLAKYVLFDTKLLVLDG